MSENPVDDAKSKDVLVCLTQRGVAVNLVEEGASGPCSMSEQSDREAFVRLDPPHSPTPWELHLPSYLTAKEVCLLLNTLLKLWTQGVRANTRSEILLQLQIARSGVVSELREKRADVLRLEQQQHTLDQAMVFVENLAGFGEEE